MFLLLDVPPQLLGDSHVVVGDKEEVLLQSVVEWGGLVGVVVVVVVVVVVMVVVVVVVVCV